MRFRFEFVAPRADVSLDQSSKTAIQNELSRLLPVGVTFTARDFAQILDRVGQLDLYHRAFVGPNVASALYVEEPRLDFTITKSPRRLHEEETCLCVHDLRREVRYKKNIAGTFEAIRDG